MEIRPILSSLRRHRTAAALIVLEIALSCAIICNALFLVSQRVEALHRPSGIAEHELLQIHLGGVGKQTDADARSREDMAALRAIPGVSGVSIVNQMPFQRGSWNTSLANTPDQEVATLNAAQYMTTPGLMKTFGLKLVAGRAFAPGSSEIVVGSAIANGFSGAQLGDRLHFAQRDWTVVGIFDAGGSGFDSEIWGDVDQLMQSFRRTSYSSMVLRIASADDIAECTP